MTNQRWSQQSKPFRKQTGRNNSFTVHNINASKQKKMHQIAIHICLYLLQVKWEYDHKCNKRVAPM
jgi:hypothetical protein